MLKQFASLKISLFLSPMAIILSVVMADKWHIIVRVLLLILGVYLIFNFFIKLNKYSQLYVNNKHNEITAKITKRVPSKHYRTLHIEYNYEGELIKNILNLSKHGKHDKYYKNLDEVEIIVVPNQPKLYFVPRILES